VEPGQERVNAPTPARDPGSPPEGVRLKASGDVTRVVLGNASDVGTLVALAWIALPLLFAALAYRVEARAALVNLAVAALIALALFNAKRLFRARRRAVEEPAICLDSERIWIERPDRLSWTAPASTAFADALSPDTPEESLPLESMPRRSVQFIHIVDSRPPGADSEAPARPRLLIEAGAGRLECAGAPSDRAKLEWVRDYLRYRLAQDD